MKKQLGLTLIELMVALGVFAILIAVGAPKLQNLSAGSKLAGVVNKLSGDISFARSEAATRNRAITFVSNNGTDWSQGWQILDGVDVLRTTIAMPAQTTLTGTVGTMAFNSDGSQAAGNVSFQACDTTLAGKPSKAIGINAAGRHHLYAGANCP